MATTGEGMAGSMDEISGAEEIRRVERERALALVNNDFQTADRLHASEYQLIPPNGQPVSKQAYLDLLASGDFQYTAIEPVGEMMVRRHGKTAIVRYQVRLEIVIDGRHVPPIPAWHTDYYEFRDGRWQAVWSQATAISSP